MSSILAGQQRNGQVAGTCDTVYGSDDHTRPVVLAEACAEESRDAAARARSVGWPPTWRPTTVVDMGSSPDLLSLIIATLAVGLSLITVVLQRRQQQREAYRGIYEVLMSDQLQRGRWLVSEISRHGDLPKNRSPDSYLIYRTLGWFDTLAMYYQRRVVPRRWVMEVWHHSLRDISTGAKVMLNERLKMSRDYAPWQYLWPLLDDAAHYQSRGLCCRPQDLAAPGSQPAAEP